MSLNQVVPLKVGDIVIIETNTPREHWPLGRVTRLLNDHLGQVRSVELFSEGQLSIKTLNKLVPLELTHNDAHTASVDARRNAHTAKGDVTLLDATNASVAHDIEALSTDGSEVPGLEGSGVMNQSPEETGSVRPRRRAATAAKQLFLDLGQHDLI